MKPNSTTALSPIALRKLPRFLHAVLVFVLSVVLAGCGMPTVLRTEKGNLLKTQRNSLPQESELHYRVALSLQNTTLEATTTVSGTRVIAEVTEYQKVRVVSKQVPDWRGIGGFFGTIVLTAGLSVLVVLLSWGMDTTTSFEPHLTKKKVERIQVPKETISETERKNENVVARAAVSQKLEASLGIAATVRLQTDAAGKASLDLKPYLTYFARNTPWTITVRFVNQTNAAPASLTVNTSDLGVTWDKPLEQAVGP